MVPRPLILTAMVPTRAVPFHHLQGVWGDVSGPGWIPMLTWPVPACP